jgi:hypothetical protein
VLTHSITLIPILGEQVHLAQIPGHVKLLAACLEIDLAAEPRRWYDANHVPQEVLLILQKHAPEIYKELEAGPFAARRTRGPKSPGITISKEPPKADEEEEIGSSSGEEESSGTESEQEVEPPKADEAALDNLNPTLEEAARFCWDSLFGSNEVSSTPSVVFGRLTKWSVLQHCTLSSSMTNGNLSLSRQKLKEMCPMILS